MGETISDLLVCRRLENSMKLGAVFMSKAGLIGELSDVSCSGGIETAYLGKWGIVRGEIGGEDSVIRRPGRPINGSLYSVGCGAIGAAGSSSAFQPA